MKTNRIAHMEHDGKLMILFPIHAPLPSDLQKMRDVKILSDVVANLVGLKGDVALVWEEEGRFCFLAPDHLHEFLRDKNMAFVNENLNKTLKILG